MCTYCGCFLSKTKTSEIQTVRSHHEPQSISTLRLQFTMHFAVPCYDAKVVLFSFVSVGVKPCETNGKAKRKKHQRCSWQLNCLQEKKKLLQNKLWKREQYQSRPDLLSNHLQRLYLFLASMMFTCVFVFCLFATYHHESITPCHRGIGENAHRPPSSPSLRTRFFWTLTHPETLQNFRPVFHSKLAFGLGLFQPKTLLSSLFSWFPANVRIKFHAFPLSGTDSRLKVQLTPS